jgi:hypothetical protein
MLVATLVPDGREEAKGGTLPERADIHMNRRQGGLEVAGHRDVVESS